MTSFASLMWWRESPVQLSPEEAVALVFAERDRPLAMSLLKMLKAAIPFPCGVRVGRGRITFLVGNYRLAALKRSRGGVRVELPFAGGVPDGFMPTGFAWRSVPVAEGFRIVRAADGLPLPPEYAKACHLLREAAPGTRLWECNVRFAACAGGGEA